MTLIDPFLLKQYLGNLAGRFDVDALAECDSTSSELLRRAERGAPSGTVLVADRQSAGRGRRGRAWSSTPGASLTFSMLWRSNRGLAGLSGLSLAVGLALTRALESLGARQIALKWPNDLLWVPVGGESAKLAGILIELAGGRRDALACVGIGLNLATPDGDFGQPVAGLDRVLAPLPERHVLLAAILRELIGVLDVFAVNGFAALKTEWQARHAWQNRPVLVLGDAPGELAGRCLGVDDEGALLLATDGGYRRVLAGDVSLRPGALRGAE